MNRTWTFKRRLHDVEAKVNEQLDLQQRGGGAVKAAGN